MCNYFRSTPTLSGDRRGVECGYTLGLILLTFIGSPAACLLVIVWENELLLGFSVARSAAMTYRCRRHFVGRFLFALLLGERERVRGNLLSHSLENSNRERMSERQSNVQSVINYI